MILVGKRISLDPRHLWMMYIPGALLIFMGILALIIPKILVLTISTLLLSGGFLLLYLARKINLTIKRIEVEEVSDAHKPEEVHRYLEDESQRSQWVN